MPSEAGAEGVLFVNIVEQGTIVVKASSTMPQEVFACLLGRELGFRVPEARVAVGEEYHHLVAAIRKETMKLDPVSRSRLRLPFGRPVVMVMEYLPGEQLEKLPLNMLEHHLLAQSTNEALRQVFHHQQYTLPLLALN